MRRPISIAALLLALLAGCATTPSGPAPGQKVSLAAEQRRLADLFRGTPVVFQMQSDGSLRVEVPVRYSFDIGGSAVKPPLAAVLDRIARSQRGQATRLQVAAPGDTGAHNPLLARDRAASTRDYLVAHGVAAIRFSALTPTRSDSVEIVVTEVAAH
jgi:outer membrane protein OmpA-like peptidoglycan-associated protein